MTNSNGDWETSEQLSNCCDAPPQTRVTIHHHRNVNMRGVRHQPQLDDGVGTCSACGEWAEFQEVEDE